MPSKRKAVSHKVIIEGAPLLTSSCMSVLNHLLTEVHSILGVKQGHVSKIDTTSNSVSSCKDRPKRSPASTASEAITIVTMITP